MTPEQATEIITIAHDLEQKIDFIVYVGQVIVAYSYIYIPLAIIIFLLWRFFSTFITMYR